MPSVPVGRRSQRAAVLPVRHDRGRGRVLDWLHSHVPRPMPRVSIDRSRGARRDGDGRGSRAVAAVARTESRRAGRRGGGASRVAGQALGQVDAAGRRGLFLSGRRWHPHLRARSQGSGRSRDGVRARERQAALDGDLRLGVHQEQVRELDGEGPVLDAAGRATAASSRSAPAPCSPRSTRRPAR